MRCGCVRCGCVDVWMCGCADVRICSVWLYEGVDVWTCGCVRCGCVVVWRLCESVDV